MDQLYQFICNPKKSIQLYSNTKDWRTWWIILGIGAFLGVIQLNHYGIPALLFWTLVSVTHLLFLSVVIDINAQIMGAASRFKTVLYWMAFVHTIFWLTGPVALIGQFLPFISLIGFFAIYMFYGMLLWWLVTAMYPLRLARRVGIFVLPVLYIIIFIMLILVYGVQLMVGA